MYFWPTLDFRMRLRHLSNVTPNTKPFLLNPNPHREQAVRQNGQSAQTVVLHMDAITRILFRLAAVVSIFTPHLVYPSQQQIRRLKIKPH